jgi:serine/threonine-protein kinase
MAAKFGACEPVVYHLRRSNLLDRGRLDQILGDFLKTDPPLEPANMANYFIVQGILTPFQAERILQGKSENLVLGPYTVVDAIGFGSMGTVYKGRSKNDGHWYALKLMPRRSMWNVRIAKRLVRKFEKIQHPSVVRFVDVNTVGANLYLAWPFVEGESLEALVRRKSRLLPGVGAYFALQAAEGLSECHKSGLIHGLLKPANLLVGPNQEIRILDFGIGALLSGSEGAELVDTMSTANAVTSGLDCRSPENILDVKVRTPAGDQYSLGCILYFCLTGQYPFEGETVVEKMLAHQIKEPTPIRSLRPEVPQRLADIVQRLMHKTPEGRLASMEEVVEVLQPFAVTSEVAGRLLALDVRDLAKVSASQVDAPSGSLPPAPQAPEPTVDTVVTKEPDHDDQPNSSFTFAQPREPSVRPRAKQVGKKTEWIIGLGFAALGTVLVVILWLLFHG